MALTATTLTTSPFIASEGSSIQGDTYPYDSFIKSQETVTNRNVVDYRQYLNSIMIMQSFRERLADRNCSLISDVEHVLSKISEKCGCFDIKEVYADYSPLTNAIRIDMVIDNDFLLIVRKKIEKGEDNGIAVSLSKGDDDYLVDYLDLDCLTEEVNYCIKG